MKLILTILAIIYVLSPYDLMPDVAFGVGWLDDLIVLWLLWRFFYATRRILFGKQGYHRQQRQYFNGQNHQRFTDGNASVLYCGDLVPTHAHVSIPWTMSYDLEPLTIIEEKKRILPQAAKENWILFYEHDAVHAASRVKDGDKGFVAVDFITL